MPGDLHKYFGITFNFITPSKVKVLIVGYIENSMLAEIPADMDEDAAAPAINHLSEVNKKDPILR